MALTLAILNTPSSTSMVAGQSCTFIAAVTNAGSTSVTLASLAASSLDGKGAYSISQPAFLTPNMPVTLGNPTLSPSTTYYYPFQVVYLSPSTSGASPAAASGAAGIGAAQYPTDTDMSLALASLSSDGTVAFATTTDPVLSGTAPFPVPQGGAFQFASAGNLINFFTSLA